jgi:hypothetical protein
MRRMNLMCLCPLLVGLLSAGPIAAQQRGPTFGSVAGAVLGAGAGLVAGGLTGGAITSNDCEPGNPDQCLGEAMPGFVWGAGAGMTVGAPLGAHVGNGRRGALGRSLLASAAIFAAEVLLLSQLVEDGRTEHMEAVRAIAITAPLLQIGTSVWIEARTDGR